MEMHLIHAWLLMVLLLGRPVVAQSNLQLLTDTEPQAVFGGEMCKIRVTLHNARHEFINAQICMQLYQTSGTLAAPLKEIPWRRINILPGQTLIDSAFLDFPAVKSQTRFLIVWIQVPNLIVGKTEVAVYPTNLLRALKSLLGKADLGVLDPNDELKPLLRRDDVNYLDLNDMSLPDFRGKLAIIGPFLSKAQMRKNLRKDVEQIARKGARVVWIQPPFSANASITPSFYVLVKDKGAVVVVHSDLVSNPAQNPLSQLNLIHFCKLALNPAPFPLPSA